MVYLFSNLEKLSHSSSFPPPPNSELVFNFCLDEVVAQIFLFIFVLPDFTTMKILLRAIDKMWHITFCIVHYFLDKYNREKPF